MSLLKSDDYIADVERQFEWYAVNAGWEVADRYAKGVEATTRLRFFVVFRPFNKHVLFYEVVGEDVVLRRVMHGHRDLPSRLLEPPST